MSHFLLCALTNIVCFYLLSHLIFLHQGPLIVSLLDSCLILVLVWTKVSLIHPSSPEISLLTQLSVFSFLSRTHLVFEFCFTPPNSPEKLWIFAPSLFVFFPVRWVLVFTFNTQVSQFPFDAQPISTITCALWVEAYRFLCTFSLL